MSEPPVLGVRELNRATLARQLLLERADLAVSAAIDRLGGLQAQLPVAPFIALWTRLAGFDRDTLATEIEQRSVIKATMMRGTLHLATATEYVRLRGALQPALSAGAAAVTRRRENNLFDEGQVLAAASAFLSIRPRTFAELSAMLADRWPNIDIGSMRLHVRTHLPLVQVPAATAWSYPGNPSFALADRWLGRPIPADDNLPALVQRYLGAFGPATRADFETWSGRKLSHDELEMSTPGLVSYRGERKQTLYDLPDQPLPGADSAAPPRFLGEFDSILLSHRLRTRILADEHRKQVYLPGLRVAATILVDGFVAGTWNVESERQASSLRIEPFHDLPADVRRDLEVEGDRLLRFLQPEAKIYAVRFGAP